MTLHQLLPVLEVRPAAGPWRAVPGSPWQASRRLVCR